MIKKPENNMVSKSDRTNISISVDFESVMELEKIFYKILNEINGKKQSGSGGTESATFEFAVDRYTVEAMTNGDTILTHHSRMNEIDEE